MSMKTDLQALVSDVFDSLSGLTTEFTYKTPAVQAMDPGTGIIVVTTVAASHTIDGFISKYKDEVIDNKANNKIAFVAVVPQDDLSVTPDKTGKLTYAGTDYEITDVLQDGISATWRFFCSI